MAVVDRADGVQRWRDRVEAYCEGWVEGNAEREQAEGAKLGDVD